MKIRETSLRIRVAGMAILGLFIALAAAAYLSGRQVKRNSELISTDAVPGTIIAHNMRMAISRSIGWVMVAASAQTTQSRDASLKTAHDADVAFTNAVTQYKATIKINPGEDRAMLDRVASQFAEFYRQRMTYEALILAGDRDGSAAFLERDLVPAYVSATQSAEELLNFNHANSITYANHIRNSVHRLYWAVAVVMVLALVCASVLVVNFAIRKREVMQLRESEEKFAKAFQSNPVGIAITEMETGRYLEVNESFCRIIGHSPQELIGRTSVELGSWSSAQERNRVFQSLRDGNTLRDFEMQLHVYEGSDKTVLVNAEMIELGGKQCIVSLVQDITERKRADEVLREEQAMFRNLADLIPDKIYFKDLQSRFTRINEALAQQFGLQNILEAEGKTDFDFHNKEHASQTYEDEQQVMRTGEPLIGREEKEMWQDGRVTWASSTKIAIRDPQGNITGLVGISRDITERKEAQEVLRATNVRYHRQEEALVKLTQSVALRQSFIPEMKREIIQIAAETLEVERVSIWRYERDRQSIVCQELFQRSTHSHSNGTVLRAGDFPAYFRALADGSIIVAHDAHRDPRTTEFSETYLHPLGISSMLDAPIHVTGSATGIVCYEHVGPARQWTADEQTFAIAIANLVSLLLAEEERQQIEGHLRQAQKMEGIGQLAGGVAHDFNNILGIIQMQSDLLKGSGSLSTDQSGFADEISTSVQRAAALTRQLLLFSRREVFQPRDLDLSASITSTAKMLMRVLSGNIQMQVKLAAEPMFINADAGMMDQVLLNLTVNARDAMPKGGQLVIETFGVELDEFASSQSTQARPGSFVCLTVSDTGSGIPPEVLPKIFEPFFTTKEVGKGTGLGLATVFGIVQQHQGWVNVYSEVGHGTAFKIYLPRLVDMSDKKIAQKMLATTQTGNETILLAEDDPSLRVSVRKALSQLGYRILEAPTGVKALEVWKENRDEIHLLLTDMVMPGGMTGKELGQRVLQDNPKLKVIYMSGFSGDVVGKDFPLEEGVNFLTKPFQASKLAQIIRDKLDAPA